MNKKIARNRRGLRTKAVLRHSLRPRLVIHKSATHIYAQIVVRGIKGDEVLVSSSTKDKELRTALAKTKVEQAQQVGELLGKRAQAKNLIDVSFDRAGYKYHGRVKALATGAREAGLNF